MLGDSPTGHSRQGPGAGALQKPNAEGLLQVSDRSGDRGLRGAQGDCGIGEGPFLDDRNQRSELTKDNCHTHSV